MSQHTEAGDIAITVGSYTKNGEVKSRYRNVGTLMKSIRDDGSEGFWLKLNAEALSPSLLIIHRHKMEKGADQVLLSVFEKKDDTSKPAEAPQDPDL